MTAPNLFISLEHYAKENFATETLAYILKKDATIRHRFLRLLRSIRPESVSLNVFSPCDIRTQVPYDGSIIDLEITPKSAKRRAQKKLQVEVKTHSLLANGRRSNHITHMNNIGVVSGNKKYTRLAAMYTK